LGEIGVFLIREGGAGVALFPCASLLPKREREREREREIMREREIIRVSE
jgi:hypothetical protein